MLLYVAFDTYRVGACDAVHVTNVPRSLQEIYSCIGWMI
jgi:hypothetical protein